MSGGEDGKVRVWSRKTGEELAVLDHHTYIGYLFQLQNCRSSIFLVLFFSFSER